MTISLGTLIRSCIRAVNYDRADAKFDWKLELDEHGAAIGVVGEIVKLDDGTQWINIVSTDEDVYNRKEDLVDFNRVEELNPTVAKRIFHVKHQLSPKDISSRLVDVLVDRLTERGFRCFLITPKVSDSPKTPPFMYFEKEDHRGQTIKIFRLHSRVAAIAYYNVENNRVPEKKPVSLLRKLIRKFIWTNS